jgi:hypothetical protein
LQPCNCRHLAQFSAKVLHLVLHPGYIQVSHPPVQGLLVSGCEPGGPLLVPVPSAEVHHRSPTPHTPTAGLTAGTLRAQPGSAWKATQHSMYTPRSQPQQQHQTSRSSGYRADQLHAIGVTDMIMCCNILMLQWKCNMLGLYRHARSAGAIPGV